MSAGTACAITTSHRPPVFGCFFFSKHFYLFFLRVPTSTPSAPALDCVAPTPDDCATRTDIVTCFQCDVPYVCRVRARQRYTGRHRWRNGVRFARRCTRTMQDRGAGTGTGAGGGVGGGGGFLSNRRIKLTAVFPMIGGGRRTVSKSDSVSSAKTGKAAAATPDSSQSVNAAATPAERPPLAAVSRNRMRRGSSLTDLNRSDSLAGTDSTAAEPCPVFSCCVFSINRVTIRHFENGRRFYSI